MNYIRKRINAFKYAFRGINQLFRNEAHAIIHLAAAIIVTIFGFVFQISSTEWCLVILCIGGVFMAEAINTAVEKLADRITKENDPYIKMAKDVAAAAVLLFVFAAIAVGLIIFIPKIIYSINN